MHEVLRAEDIAGRAWHDLTLRSYVGRRARCIAVAAFVFSSTAAMAGADSETVRKFGLPGTWAMNCAKPPSEDNIYGDVRAPDGEYPTMTYYYAPDKRFSSEMRNARIVAPNRLAYLDVRKADGDLINVVLEISGGRYRSLEAIGAKNGNAYVKDGVGVADGKPTDSFEKCSGPQ